MSAIRGKQEENKTGNWLSTDELMSAVVPSATGLRTERRISHVFVMDVPTYPRPLFITDAAINIYPTLEAGYMLAKADSAGIVLGARIPIVLTSRADSAAARLASCAIAAAFAHRLRENRGIK